MEVAAPLLPAGRVQRKIDVVAERILNDNGPSAIRVLRRNRLDARVPIVAIAASAAENGCALGNVLGELRQHVVVNGVFVRSRVLVHDKQTTAC